MTEPVEVEKPSVPFTMLGAPDAAACEGDSCLVVLPSTAGGSSDGVTDDEPGRRGVSR
ncbi:MULTISPECIES: hypothetical protein [unclassified Frigoribacterium]|uniref:hypothetical protein n=1 Tax=unclassified Frigoribacterium TaxID=2627005 RepID=UPI000AB998BF|nr:MULTISPECIES: hypothetical protein [unclassified Frigoribacterium]